MASGSCDVLPSASTLRTAGVVEQHFARRDAAAALFLEQHLGDDAAQVLASASCTCRRSSARIEIDDPVDRAAGARRGQPSDDQLAAGSRIQRQVHQVGRPQLLEHEHVRILAERRARRRQHLVGAAADLTLADEAHRRDRERR